MEDNRLLLRGREVAKLAGISLSLTYRWMQDGTLPTVRIGRTVRVPRERLLQFIDEKTQQAQATGA